MPIAFNEPLSFLQRITEYMEHVYLIRSACCQPQALERMQVGGGLLPGGVGHGACVPDCSLIGHIVVGARHLSWRTSGG